MCGVDCRVRAICYGGLRWTPWTPWGSWLWPVRPVDSLPALRPTPHPPPSQQSITSPPSRRLAAGAARMATGASDTSATANGGKQMKEELTTVVCSSLVVLSEWRIETPDPRWCCPRGVLVMCKRTPAERRNWRKEGQTGNMTVHSFTWKGFTAGCQIQYLHILILFRISLFCGK